MKVTKDVILAGWKDESYRESLPADVREALPEKPRGGDGSELSDEQLESAAGGFLPIAVGVAGIVGGGLTIGAALENSADSCDTKTQ